MGTARSSSTLGAGGLFVAFSLLLSIVTTSASDLAEEPSASGRTPGPSGPASRGGPFALTLQPQPRAEGPESSGGSFRLIGEARPPSKAKASLIFADGFESGDSCGWSSSMGDAHGCSGLPSGAVAFVDGPSCPPGWSIFAALSGRAVVGLGPGGLLRGEVGAPLTDLDLPAHGHRLRFSGASSTNGGHGHVWSWLVTPTLRWLSSNSLGQPQVLIDWSDGIGNGGSGVFPYSAPLPSFQYTERSGSHQHLWEQIAATTSVGAARPTLQLLACRKD